MKKKEHIVLFKKKSEGTNLNNKNRNLFIAFGRIERIFGWKTFSLRRKILLLLLNFYLEFNFSIHFSFANRFLDSVFLFYNHSRWGAKDKYWQIIRVRFNVFYRAVERGSVNFGRERKKS